MEEISKVNSIAKHHSPQYILDTDIKPSVSCSPNETLETATSYDLTEDDCFCFTLNSKKYKQISENHLNYQYSALFERIDFAVDLRRNCKCVTCNSFEDKIFTDILAFIEKYPRNELVRYHEIVNSQQHLPKFIF